MHRRVGQRRTVLRDDPRRRAPSSTRSPARGRPRRAGPGDDGDPSSPTSSPSCTASTSTPSASATSPDARATSIARSPAGRSSGTGPRPATSRPSTTSPSSSPIACPPSRASPWSTATTGSATASPTRRPARSRPCSTGSCARSATRSPTSATSAPTGRRRTAAAVATTTRPAPAGSARSTTSVERYAKHSARDLAAIDFYVAFQLWRTAIILEGVYARYLGGAYGGQQLGAELDVLRDSPVELIEQAQAALAGCGRTRCTTSPQLRRGRHRVGSQRARRRDHDRPHRSPRARRRGPADAGGGTRSAELTEPGFVHDVCSAIHPLGVASPALRTMPLDRHGLRWIHPAVPLAHPLDDHTVLLERSVDATSARLGADGKAWTPPVRARRRRRLRPRRRRAVAAVAAPPSDQRWPASGCTPCARRRRLRRSRFVGRRGAGAVRRCRRPRRSCRSTGRSPPASACSSPPSDTSPAGRSRRAARRRSPTPSSPSCAATAARWSAAGRSQPRRVAAVHGRPRRRRAAPPRGHRR